MLHMISTGPLYSHSDAHGACAAGLPGIWDVNLVSHTMGDGMFCFCGVCGKKKASLYISFSLSLSLHLGLPLDLHLVLSLSFS